MSVTGIVAALTVEARTLGVAQPAPQHRCVDGISISILGDGNLLVISGMGPEAATRAACALGAAGARALLSFGLAGALDPALRAGAVLLPRAVRNDTGQVHTTYDPWRERLAAAAAARLDARPAADGTLLSVAQPLITAASKSQAWRNTGACAIDMESFAIAEIAARLNVKFAVARVVVDTASDTLPPGILNATGPRGEVHGARLLAALVRAPAQLPALLQLSRRYWAALRVLKVLGGAELGLS